MTIRLKPQDLTPIISSPFMTTHGARLAVPLAQAIASPELFLTVRSNLRAGDRVQLCRYDTGDWTKARLLECGEVIITQSTAKAVVFRQIGAIIDLEAADPALEVVKTEPQLAELEIVDDPQGGFIVRETVSGHVHKHFKATAKPAAERYVKDYGGAPAPAAA